MCEPTTMLAAASFAMTAMGSMSANSEAQDQADAVNAAHEQNRVNALASMRNDYNQLSQRQGQERDAAGLEATKRKAQERSELSTARVGAGEAGISGLSVEGIMRDISSLSLKDTDAINQGADWKVDQLAAEMAGVRTSTKSRIDSQATASGPSGWSTAFEIGGAGINAYSGYKANKDALAASKS